MLTQAILMEVLSYNPDTGIFTSYRTRKAVGWISEHGRGDKKVPYIKISVLGREHYAHRLAWLYMTGSWPANEVDHEDIDGMNNRWLNLRDATHAQNGHNQGLRRNNKSGVKGVSWSASRNKWQATITINGREKGLGRFETIEEATAARRIAEAEHHGAYAHQTGAA